MIIEVTMEEFKKIMLKNEYKESKTNKGTFVKKIYNFISHIKITEIDAKFVNFEKIRKFDSGTVRFAQKRKMTKLILKLQKILDQELEPYSRATTGFEWCVDRVRYQCDDGCCDQYIEATLYTCNLHCYCCNDKQKNIITYESVGKIKDIYDYSDYIRIKAFTQEAIDKALKLFESVKFCENCEVTTNTF